MQKTAEAGPEMTCVKDGKVRVDIYRDGKGGQELRCPKCGCIFSKAPASNWHS